MRDVVQEGGVDKNRVRRDRNRRDRIALDKTGSRHILRKTARRAGDEIAILIGRNHRDVADVRVSQLEPEEVGRLVLDHRPSGQAAIGRGEELARRNRPIGSVVDVFTREDLMRRMRGVGLALIHERGVGVGCAAETVRAGHDGAPRHDHEALAGRQVIGVAENMVRPGNQRVVGLEWHEDRAIAAVGDLVEAMVKKLPEDREQ